MFKHTTSPARLLLGLVLVLSGFGFGRAQDSSSTAPLTPEVKQQVLDAIADVVQKQAYLPEVDFSKWPQFLATEKAAIDKATTPRDFTKAVNEAFHHFGVSHILLATPQQAEARRDKAAIGIGVSLQAEPDGLRVVNLFPAAPAAEAGVELGDLIIEADGKKPDSPAQLVGDEGTTISIKVKKADGQVKSYTIKRAKFSSLRPETLTWIGSDVAILRIYTFDQTYDRKRVENLMTQAAKAKELIVDLRSNGGGLVYNMMHLLGLLLKDGTPVGSFVSRSMVDRFVKETGGKPDDSLKIAFWSPRKVRAQQQAVPVYTGHVAVLINGGTGSAAEIVTAALQDTLEAPVVGSRSAGAVLVSVMQPLPDGFQMQYPLSDYVTMHGVRLEGKGIEPDAEAPIPRYGQKDVAIDKAVALLHRMELRDARYGKDESGN